MAYPSIPPRPAYDADWTALGDAWHAALTQALSDDPVIRADLTSVKGTVAGLAAGLAPTANPSFTGTVTGISKGMVGLGNVDNTADAAKAIDGAQITSGVLDPARLPAGCAAIRTRLPAGEANPSATNWAARPSGYPLVLSIGAPPGPVDALATDIHVPTATAAAPSTPQPIALTDGSTIPLWAGSELFDQTQLVGAVTTQVTAQATYDAYTSRLPAAKLLPGFRQMAANACALLYTSMAQVPYKHPNLTLVFSSTSGVLAQTWKSLSKIEFGPLSVGAAVTASYSTHEVVHLFQHSPTNGTAQTSGVIEGIADWVLVQMGYHTAANQRPAGGGTAWDAGYDTTAFFFDWVEKTAGGGTPGFVRALNQSLNTSTWNASVITSLNVQGKTVDQLWAEYKTWLGAPTASLPLTDRTGVSFTGAGQTGQYHAWASGLTAGAGLLVWLHGDAAYEHNNPTSTYVFGGTNGVTAVGRARGYIVVSARTPDTTGDVTWWENGNGNADYLAALLDHLTAGYATDPTKVVLAGYSGGAQQITQFFLARYPNRLSRGWGTIVFGGGEAPDITPTFSTAIKAQLTMHWAAGELDTAANSSDGFGGREAATAGEAWYRAKGFARTSIQLIAGKGHALDGLFGGIVAARLDGTPVVTPPTQDAGWKEVALRITSTAENSTTNWTTAYSYIEDIGDRRGYTAGIVGWCSGTGDMLVLVQYAAQQTPGNLLEKWIPKLQQIMAAAYSQRPSLSDSLLGSAYIADWKTAAAQAWFQAAQRAERDRLYWGPAAAQATKDGVGNCGRAVMYDISVNHGQGSDPESFGGICAAAAAQAKPPSQGGTEKAYLLALCDKRDAVLRSWGDYQSNGRSPAFRNLVNNNMNFNFPITWSMYGSSYSITSLPTGPG